MRIRLRTARADELLRLTAFETDPEAAPFVNTYAPDEHARMAARDDVAYLAIERDGALDGFVLLVLDPDGESVELRRIVAATRDRGFGQFALAAAERHCRDVLGRERVWLDVAPDNARARHIYAKRGYATFGRPPGPEGEEFLAKRIT